MMRNREQETPSDEERGERKAPIQINGYANLGTEIQAKHQIQSQRSLIGLLKYQFGFSLLVFRKLGFVRGALIFSAQLEIGGIRSV